MLLLPPSLREWLPDDHLAWFVIDAVAEMDLEPFYAAYRQDGWGRAAFDPRMMVGLLLYAYAIGERSSRAIERRCREDVAFLFERLVPVNPFRLPLRNAHFSFGARGAPSRIEAVPASQFACGPSGGQKAAGAGRDKIGVGRCGLKGSSRLSTCQQAIRTLRATADLAGFALPVRALTSE